MYNANVGVEKG